MPKKSYLRIYLSDLNGKSLTLLIPKRITIKYFLEKTGIKGPISQVVWDCTDGNCKQKAKFIIDTTEFFMDLGEYIVGKISEQGCQKWQDELVRGDDDYFQIRRKNLPEMELLKISSFLLENRNFFNKTR